MAKKIFVSYNFNDKEVVHTVQSMMQSNQGKIQGKLVFVENDVSHEGTNAIDREIRRVIYGCDVALFVVGNNNHNSPWINREAELAISNGACIVVSKLPKTNGGIPNALIHHHYYEANWSSNDLSYHLNRCKKNKKV